MQKKSFESEFDKICEEKHREKELRKNDLMIIYVLILFTWMRMVKYISVIPKNKN